MNGRKNRFKKFFEELKKNKGKGSKNEVGLVKRERGDISGTQKEYRGELLFVEDERKPEKKERDHIRALCISVIAASLSVAVVIASFSVYMAVKSEDVTDIPENTEDKTPTHTVSEKVIYIRDYDSESGILSASELYSLCAPSTVTVICSSGDEETVGSGFIISEDGYIATAAHVVTGAEKITVVTSDGIKREANIVAEDGFSDVALLKTDASVLTPVDFGRSDELLVGERVYAIGTPAAIEYSGTLSAGKITYVGRKIEIAGRNGQTGKRLTVLQTDAQLNTGNSGCPIFDQYGRVVGMVSMKLGGTYTGISFALPSDGILPVLNAMKKGEPITRDTVSGIVSFPAKLGVGGECSERDGTFGYIIDRFIECGATTDTFLRIGDFITQIDGVAVRSESDIERALNGKTAGDKASVCVIRSGQSLSFEVILGM